MDPNAFKSVVFRVLKLYFTPHPFGHGRTLLDTTPEEKDKVAAKTGMQLYRKTEGTMYFTVESVVVTRQERLALLQRLQNKVLDLISDARYQTDGYVCSLAVFLPAPPKAHTSQSCKVCATCAHLYVLGVVILCSAIACQVRLACGLVCMVLLFVGYNAAPLPSFLTAWSAELPDTLLCQGFQ